MLHVTVPPTPEPEAPWGVVIRVPRDLISSNPERDRGSAARKARLAGIDQVALQAALMRLSERPSRAPQLRHLWPWLKGLENTPFAIMNCQDCKQEAYHHQMSAPDAKDRIEMHCERCGVVGLWLLWEWAPDKIQIRGRER